MGMAFPMQKGPAIAGPLEVVYCGGLLFEVLDEACVECRRQHGALLMSQPGIGWKLFQISILLGFMVCNIELQWGISGIAAPVMGGMLAWYLTGISAAALDSGKAVLRSLRRTADH
jgi:hypothetical protein